MPDRSRRETRFDELVRSLGDPRATPDVGWVATLTRRPPDRVVAALAELAAFLPTERELRSTLRAGGRRMYAAISAPFELYALTRLLRPTHIVELGVSSGVSSTHFLLALRQNGRGLLHSIDLPTFQRGHVLGKGESPVSIPPGRRSGWAVPAALKGGWDLRVGPTERLLEPLLEEIPRVDLFLHDDLHTPEHLAWELRSIRPRLHPGSVLLADNCAWTGDAFPDFARSLGVASHAKRGRDLMGLRVPESAHRR